MTLPVRNARLKLSQGQLFWREVGHGKTLIFLHDAWEDGNQWMFVVEQLSATQHCIVPDLLGCGESDRPRVTYSVELQVECLTELAETLRLKKVWLVGKGLGGWIAASWALRHPELVQGLVLLSPEGVAVTEGSGRWRWARALTARLPITLWLLQLLSPVARFMGKKRLDDLLQQRKVWRRSPGACQILFNRRAVAIRAEQLNDRMEWLKSPTLLLLGDRASALTRSLIRAYTAAPNAQIQEIAGGDDLLLQEAGAIAEQIHQFVVKS